MTEGEEHRHHDRRCPDDFLVLLETIDDGVGDFVWSRCKRRGLHTFGHVRVHETRTNDNTSRASPNEGVAEGLAKRIHPRL